MEMVSQNSFLLFLLAILILYLPSETKGHFLSIEDLEEFYDLEEKLVATFTTYIEEQKQILDVVKQRYEDQKKWQPALNNTDEYLSNALNVHAMIKRMVSDWPLTLALLGGSFADEEEEESIKLPTIQEYRAAVHSIARLQQVYNYTIDELVSGSAFPGTDKTSLLTADDCMAIGRDLYENRHYQLAIGWFKEALSQATNQSKAGKDVVTNSNDHPSPAPPIENIYEYLALATCFTGDQRQSKKYFKRLYSEFHEFRPTQHLISDHLLAINDTCKKLIDNESLKPRDHKLGLTWKEEAALSANYTSLCQGKAAPNMSHDVSCFLDDWGGDPYLLLQPFKTEVLREQPFIYITYDVISPAESEFIMTNLMDEKIMHANGFVYEFWKPLPKNSTISESLLRRMHLISGYTIHNTRSQVVLSSAPVGSEYVIDRDLDPQIKEPGKFRLGSTMFYLEAPLAGGLTVFPRLGLSVAPVAGAALTTMYITLDKVDDRSVHGMCPIIQGHQTTLTMWFKRDW